MKFELLGFSRKDLSDPYNKSYIVGASEEENERYREHLKKVYHPGRKLEDMFTPEQINKIFSNPAKLERFSYTFTSDITCEQYNDIMKIKGMPGNCFNYSLKYGISERISDMMEQYYDGNFTREEILQKVKNACMDMRVYLFQDRYTDGCTDKDNLQILRDIYEVAQKTNARKAVWSSLKKGEKLAQKFEGPERYDWMYYDADDYYKSEDIRECIRQAISEMAEKWEIDPPDFDEVEENSKLILDGRLDYNSIWQWQAWQRDVVRMTDLKTAPPEGFSFFYKERKEIRKDPGYVEVSYQGKKWSADVPFNNFDVKKDIAQFFRMGDFAKKYLAGCSKTDCNEFLKKFEIFQKAYMRDDNKWWEMI